MKKLLLNKKNIILFVLLILLIIICTSSPFIINSINEIIQKNEIEEIEWKTYGKNGDVRLVLVTIRNQEGIEQIKDVTNTSSDFIIYANGKNSVAFDYKMEDKKTYKFEAKFLDGTSKTYTIEYEKPRVKAEYTLIDGVYVNEPDTSKFVKEKTRYMYLDDNGNLVPGNWLNGEKPDEWYSYGLQKWANVYIENNGIESYWVWVPRYVYKIDEERQFHGDALNDANERMDVKFVNMYDEYIDPITGQKQTFEELKAQGYELPEAFTWQGGSSNVGIGSNVDTEIPGYWVAKYQASDLGSYVINFELTASREGLVVKGITTNTEKTIATYTYAVNGQIIYPNTNSPQDRTLNNPNTGHETINVTALDENGQIIGSMTKDLYYADVNAPDLTGFDKDTTFYVYWDENNNEHNEIPISQNPPANWYNYTYREWANIVTRNNGVESYFVWVPRYAYSLDQTSQKSNIIFLQGTSSDIPTGYEIPEAFKWGDNLENELTGYWVGKYQASDEESQPRLSAEISSSSDKIVVGQLTGSRVEEGLKYEFYLNGVKQTTLYDPSDGFIYRGLTENTTYTVNIIARKISNDEYVAAITKKLETFGVNKPLFAKPDENNQLKGFNPEKTYYVLYSSDGQRNEVETIGEKIRLDGSNAPANWYDYSQQKWANIVVTDGIVENGQITGETYKNYFLWVPRYAYRLNQTRQRAEIIFIKGTGSEVPAGYEIPEAFKWGDNLENELTGYWVGKYQASN